MYEEKMLEELATALRVAVSFKSCAHNNLLMEHCNEDGCYSCKDRLIIAIERKARSEYTHGYGDGYDAGYDAGYDEGFASADDWYAEHDEELAEHGWYRALCVDRKPMLLGDRMEWTNGTFTIHELKFTEDGCTTWDSEHGCTVHADECHHHATTVEDVLREFALRVAGKECMTVRSGIVDEYAAKLQLREVDE